MITVTVEDLQENLDKYIEIGKKEKIDVTRNGKSIFVIVPKKMAYLGISKYFGTLPNNIDIKNIKRE